MAIDGFDGRALVARLRRATTDAAGFLLTTEMGGAFALGFRTTRLLTFFTLAVARGLRLADSFGFVVVLRLRTFRLAGLAFRRGAFGLLRGTRRTACAAGFAAFPERGFFVFIPGSDPVGGYRILSDAAYNTAAACGVQCEFALNLP